MTSARIGWAFAVAAVVASLLPSEARACTTNEQCKGGRICVQGVCVTPPAPAPTPPPPAATPAPAASEPRACVREKDCPGDDTCVNGRCMPPGAAAAPMSVPPPAPAPVSTPPAASSPAAPLVGQACEQEKDCPGNDTCINHLCVPFGSAPAAPPPPPPPVVKSTPPPPPPPPAAPARPVLRSLFYAGGLYAMESASSPAGDAKSLSGPGGELGLQLGIGLGDHFSLVLLGRGGIVAVDGGQLFPVAFGLGGRIEALGPLSILVAFGYALEPSRSSNGVSHNPMWMGPVVMGGPAIRLGDSAAFLHLLAGYHLLSGTVSLQPSAPPPLNAKYDLSVNLLSLTAAIGVGF